MLTYIPLNIVTPSYYEKTVFNFITTANNTNILLRDNGRIKAVIYINNFAAVINPQLCFDSNDGSGGIMDMSGLMQKELDWYKDSILVQSSMYLVGYPPGLSVTVTAIRMTQSQIERQNNAVNSFRSIEKEIQTYNQQSIASTGKRKPGNGKWQCQALRIIDTNQRIILPNS